MKFLPIVLLLSLLTAPALALNFSNVEPSNRVDDDRLTSLTPDVPLDNAANLCMEVKSMFEWAKLNEKEVWTLSKSGQDKLRKMINMNRSRNNKPLLSEDAVFYFIPLVNPMQDGLVYFDHGCAVDEMTMPVDTATVAQIFISAGVVADEIIKAVE